MTVSRSCCKGRACSLKPGRKAGGVEGTVLVMSLTGLATKLKGEEQGRNRGRKMLVLSKTVKIPLSQHGLGELSESMETFHVCLCFGYFSHGPHEAAEYLKCA